MAVSTIRSGNANGEDASVLDQRLLVNSIFVAGDVGDGSQAQVTAGRVQADAVIVSSGGDPASVDGDGRLAVLALPDTSLRTVTTGQHTVDDTAVVTIANTESNRESLIIQNQLGGPIAIVFGTATPGASDFRIAAGATFVVPFAWAGVVKAIGLNTSVSGNVVVVSAKT